MFGKNLKQKVLSLFIAVILLTSAGALLSVSQLVDAQTADVNAKMELFLSCRPTKVGLGQELLINMWASPAPGANRQYNDYTLTITKPDGAKLEYTMDTYVADGTMWMPWVCDQVGDWKFDLSFPGAYFPAGRYLDGVYYAPNEIIPPSESNPFGGAGATNYTQSVSLPAARARTITVTVQQDTIPSWPGSPLPTGYWTRPVNEINREWWPILGNYPWFGPGGGELWDELYPNTNPTYNSAYAFVPWVEGPESAHVAWKREYYIGGLMGGDLGAASSTYWGDVAWLHRPTVILDGMGYQVVLKPAADGPAQTSWWQCYDVRTGDILWERPLYPGEQEPTLIEYGITSLAVPGALPKSDTPYLLSISGGYMRKYNPLTGAMVLNVSIAPMTGAGGTYYMNGHVLGIQDLGADAGAERYRLINWTTFGTGSNFASRVVSNTTYARSALPTAALTDWDVGIGCTMGSISAGGIYIQQSIQAFDLLTGRSLWNKTIDEPQYSGAANVADHGKLAVLSVNGYYLGFDLRTGNEVWRTRTLDYPWDASGWGSYGVITAYGKLYWVAQTGIYAINWDTGVIEWKFEAEAPPFETPMVNAEGEPVYPFHAPGMAADGKLYVYATEHSPDVPYYRGSPTVCVDAFTGDLIWSFGIAGAGQHTRTASLLRVSDGYAFLGALDGYMYAIGKGLSETTVSVPQPQLTLGQKAFLTGTVLDLSPAQPGAPCVAKESVGALMEQIHLQAQIGGINNVPMIGVPVSLDAVGPDGEYIHLGMVTSDGYSGTFAFDKWQPETAGLYTITATFMGDESYGSSFATTYLTVAKGSDTNVDNANNTDNGTVITTVIGATIALIIALAIVCVLILRKKP